MEINEYSILSRADLMNTLQQISREISDNNIFQLYHNFLARLRAVVKFKSTITHNYNNEIALNPFDSKRHWIDDINSLPYEYLI